MFYIGNAFSLQMLSSLNQEWLSNATTNIEVQEISKNMFTSLIERYDAKSCIGHQDLASILDLPFNRESITLESGDHLLVAQLVGGRLEEGTTTLPPTHKLKFLLVKVK